MAPRQPRNATTAKIWTKNAAKKALGDINGELTTVLKGGDPVAAITRIQKHLKMLEDLKSPPKTEPTSTPKPKLPGHIRNKIQTVINKNKELITVLQQWDPSLNLKDNKAVQKRKGAKSGK